MSQGSSPSGAEGKTSGYVVVDPGTQGEVTVPLLDRLFVGRECAGVDDAHRILLGDDLAVSRNHLEIRVEPEASRIVVVDTSSNGVRVNTTRIERAVAVVLNNGDRISVGSHLLEFRSAMETTQRPASSEHRATTSIAAPMTLAIVVGDIINFSTVSEQAEQRILVRDVHALYHECRELLTKYKGTLSNYVGDAFFAIWEFDVDPAAGANALNFALEADTVVAKCAPDLELRYADGSPLRMGWGASFGPATMQLMTGSNVVVLGDAVNVAFRISGIAGREGRPHILATQSLRDVADGPFTFGEPETVSVKGRVGTETIYGVFPQ
ncbi:MAG: FHA domain-containing protein [Acidimicrobiales bacterium]